MDFMIWALVVECEDAVIGKHYEVGYFVDYDRPDVRYTRKQKQALYKQVKAQATADYGYWNSIYGCGVSTKVALNQLKPEHKAKIADTFDLSLEKSRELIKLNG